MARSNQKKKRKGGPVDSLTDDIRADIISRVPYKSTCCCKCISRRWRDLIAHRDHRKKMPQSLVGFFFERDDDVACFPKKVCYFINAIAHGCPPLVDPSLSFLPNQESLYILDSCNGLLLCCFRYGTDPDGEMLDYVVCNPSTEKWVLVPASNWSSRAEVYLAFDPAVSSHFYVCELVDDEAWDNDDYENTGCIAAAGIYSSRTGVWCHKDDAWSVYETNIPTSAKSVFFRGKLHLCTSDHELIAIDVEENNWKFIPLPGTERDDDISYDIYLSHGQLHFAHDGPYELFIWVLEDPSREIWTLKRTISHLHLFGTEYLASAGDYSVISIHPEENLIFLVAGQMRMTLMSYEMDSMKRHVIRQLGSVRRWPSWNRVRCIPYVPLFLESLADGH